MYRTSYAAQGNIMQLLEIARLYLPRAKSLIIESARIRYSAMHLSPDIDRLPASGLANATGALAELRWVYSLGILERCHLVSITSLTRLCRWLDACVVMANPPNALAFSAAPPLAQFPVGANILDAH